MPRSSNSQQSAQSDSYEHRDQATQRPDAGVQTQFTDKRQPKTYRYDSSLAPELSWDESAERDFAEWLLELIAQAAEKGEAEVFAKPQQWAGKDHEQFTSTRECVNRLKSLSQPFLNWSGKAERQQISVPTIPLFVHERHSTEAILKTLEGYKQRGETLDLFGDGGKTITESLDAYEHKGPWSNRMILGDSLQVMNSLLEYEGMGGQIQMVYMDPPYGVKFGSNFQPFVRKRDVTHGKDEDMVREPEMVKAYRDTWELGLHSYLSYLRDRLLLARELITNSGSIFVQISDENLHHVREVLDEVFGAENFVSLISYTSTSGFTSSTLSRAGDYILWFAKAKPVMKFNQLYGKKASPISDVKSKYKRLMSGTGDIRTLSPKERSGAESLPDSLRLFRNGALDSQDPPNEPTPFDFQGHTYYPPKGRHWTANYPDGMERLRAAKRIIVEGKGLAYVRYFDDFSVQPINNLWNDIGGAVQSRSDPKIYAVQTGAGVVARCMQMVTDSGDLVFDPTCGSGTTAYVAEQWGRRWITADTSRVPLALARQRLLTSTFPWYELKNPDKGPSAGFIYERKKNRKGEEIGGLVPRITLRSIANDEEPETVTLVDKPNQNKNVTRVAGRFTVEATVQAADTMLAEQGYGAAEDSGDYDSPRAWLDRMIEVLRQARTLHLPGNHSIRLETVRAVDDCEQLHAEATLQNGTEQRVAIVFGPEGGAIDDETVYEAASEARFERYDQLFFFGFGMSSSARQLVEDRKKLKLPCTFVAMRPDVVMSDLLKTNVHSEIFSLTGLPDVELRAAESKDANGEYEVELLGLDVFFPDSMKTESTAAENLPCWMLDTDYNGRCFCASQVFFPKTSAWDNLQKSLKGRFDESVWGHLSGTTSESFPLGKHRRIAVKVIDERGNELMAVREAS